MVFLVELGHNSQQLLYCTLEMGETSGWDATQPSPGQTSARGRPWATHRCKELKKQVARCVRVFPYALLQTWCCSPCPDLGSHAVGSRFLWLSQRSEPVPAWLLGLVRLWVKAFAAADAAPAQTAPRNTFCPPKISCGERDAPMMVPTSTLVWVDATGLGLQPHGDAGAGGCNILQGSHTPQG